MRVMEDGREQRVFATTHWSIVLAAGDASSPASAGALEQLCRSCWYPVYAFLRRLGHNPTDSQDLTQGFFAFLLERELITKATPEAGRFRSFLLGTLQNWLSNEWRKAAAIKRGAGAKLVEIDALDAEQRYALEPATDETPAARFERSWAEALVGRALDRLGQESAQAGDDRRFQLLKPVLLGQGASATYAELAVQAGMSESAIKVAIHRLRKRFGEILRATLAEGVADPLEVDAELRQLLLVLSR